MITISPISNLDDKSNVRTIINQVVRQVSDTTGSFTVSANGNFTLKNSKIFGGSVIILSPRTSPASAARWFFPTVTEGEAIITFSSVLGSATFDYVIIGAQ